MALPVIHKAKLVNLYKKERDPKVKEILLLIVVLANIGDIIAYRHGLHFCAWK